jgi:hypothetical protein
MNTHADKTQENKSQAVSTVDSQMQSGGEATFQFVDNRPEAVAQRKLQEMANNSPQVSQLRAFQDMANNSSQVKQAAQLQAMVDNYSAQQSQPIQKKENNTGLPDNLKTGMENLSGMSLDDVKVYRNSDKPAQLQAHAYAQGTDIHLGPRQEKHLPHEAWHVVQQKQGRVKPTMQLKGKVNVNDNADLEKEADVMGAKAMQSFDVTLQKKSIVWGNSTINQPIQRIEIPDVDYSHQDLTSYIQQKKVDFGIGDVSNLNIARYVSDWLENAVDSDRRVNPNPNTAAATITTSLRAELGHGGGGWHVPRNQDVEHTVNGVTYEFHNDGNGCLDFMAPLNGRPACPDAGGNWDFVIHDPTNGNQLINTGQPLNSGSRAQHFREANIIREGIDPPANGGSSPAGYTWHHHEQTGRMQLIDRDVHAAFSHKGGFSIWGS